MSPLLALWAVTALAQQPIPAEYPIDIERFRPQLVCIEAHHLRSRKRIPEYFAAHGYVRIEAYRAHDDVNDYYTPAGE